MAYWWPVDTASEPRFPRIPDHVNEAVLALRDRMRSRFGARFVEARLFGSYARGEQHDESDVDVLLLFAEPLDRETEDSIFDDVAAIDIRYKLWISPRILTRDHFDEMLRSELRFATDVDREGIRM
jgi:predicted nucleotidyltransferase